MRSPNLLLATGVALATLVLTSTKAAHAVGRFPGGIYRHLNASYTVAPYEPPCSVCHLRGSTGSGTAQTPFALSMKSRGMIAGDMNSLYDALDALDREAIDSDADGTPDIQEIERDTDPNTPANVSLSGQAGPNAGCGGGQQEGFAGGRPASAIGLLGSLALVWSRRRRGRRRARRDSHLRRM
jgi:hypothetical protein